MKKVGLMIRRAKALSRVDESNFSTRTPRPPRAPSRALLLSSGGVFAAVALAAVALASVALLGVLAQRLRGALDLAAAVWRRCGAAL